MAGIRVHLTGDDAELGVVPAADVARLILALERAASLAASVVLGQPKTTSGRFGDAIENAVRFWLLAVEAGSVTLALELPEPEPADRLPVDVPTLGQSALAMLLDVAGGLGRPHPVVQRAVLDIADRLRLGDRYDAVTFDVPSNGSSRRRIRLDGGGRSRLRAEVAKASTRVAEPHSVTGILVEADFERRTARLRTAIQPGVQVAFEEELANAVQAALRQPATLEGEVVFDPATHEVRSVTLRRMQQHEQLALLTPAGDYWSDRSLDDLAREQDARRPVDLDALHAADATDGEREAFMRALAELG